MNARDLVAAALVGLGLAATVPGYDRVFATVAWRAPALSAGLLAIAVAVLVRVVRRGLLLGTIASLLGMVATLPWLLGVTSGPVLPTPSHLGELGSLLAQGLREVAVTPAPAEPTVALLLLVVGGFWVVGFTATEAVVRVRRPGAGLVSLAVLWAAPLAIPLSASRSWLTGVPFLAVAAVVLLVVRPGHELADDSDGAPALGVVLAAVAIAVAATVPGLLPGYDAPAWVTLGSSATPRGYQPIVDISTRLRLPEERDVLRVQASQRTYLRLAGLDTFDGASWRLGPPGEGAYRPDPANLYTATDVLPPEEPAEHSELVYVDVEVLALENIYVPVPYQPIELLGPQRSEMVWSTDGGFLATWETVEDGLGSGPTVGLREGMGYRVQAARPTPSFDDLTDAAWDPDTLARYTQLPRSYTELGALAEEVYDAAGATTAVEQALALQEWFTSSAGGFTYDLDVPALRGDRALTDFVLEDRVGYCEYFATAMAVMLRETGIPARVAVGFLPGRVSNPASPAEGRELTEFTVSTADAHAWVEVLFPGHGWLTFEPTPRDDSTQIVPTADDLAPIENLRERRARELRELAEQGLTDDPVQDAPDLPDGEQDERAPDGSDTTDGRDDGAADDGGGLVLRSIWSELLRLVLGGSIVVAVVRRRRARRLAHGTPRERILAAQRRLLAVTAAHGIGRHRHETLRELLDRWHTEGRTYEVDGETRRIVEAAAFGGSVTAGEAAAVERDLAALLVELKASVTSRDRALSPVRVPATTAASSLRRGAVVVKERVERLTGPPV